MPWRRIERSFRLPSPRGCRPTAGAREESEREEGMADVTIKQLDQFESSFGGAFKLVRHGLGVESFGMQVIDMPPNADQYPEHDHAEDGQEEVYTALDGSATLQVEGTEHDLTPGVFARVGPGQKRKIVTGEKGVRLLALGGVPGKAYEAPQFSKPEG
jgi:quercetin dioxygenase-like cupin family protein